MKKETCTKLITVKVTPSDKVRWDKAAADRGTTIARICKDALESHAKQVLGS